MFEEQLELKDYDLTMKGSANKVRSFLCSCGLLYEPMQHYVTLENQSDIIAGGGIDKNVIKCVAVKESARQNSLINGLITYIRNAIFSLGYENSFVFTKPEYERVFKSLAFYTVARCEKAILLESDRSGVSSYAKQLAQLSKVGTSGAIVVNCNPITKGHLYLIERAAAEVDYLHLFVVEEDRSAFKFEDRYALVQEATANIKNVILHKGGDYIISAATFPSYFIKDASQVAKAQMELDLDIFARIIAKSLNVTKRFVGSESEQLLCGYNAEMKRILSLYGIECIEIDRLCANGEVISASRVRQLFKEGKIEQIEPLVPNCTYRFLADGRGDYAK